MLNNTIYQLTNSVVLKHDLPWEMEWRCAGDWRGVMFSTSLVPNTTGMQYISRTVGGQLSMGTWTGQQYDNYGVDLSYLDDQIHTYRFVNRIEEDGSNMVWIYVDGEEIGPMNHYYIGSKDQGTTSDWICGQDFVFSYSGMEGHALRDCKLDYLQVWEAGELPALEGFEYTLDEEAGTVTLTKYTGTEPEVTVHGAYYVEGAAYDTVLDASSVFRGNATITAVTILGGVSFLNGSMSYLFAECTKLVSVDLSQADTTGVTDMSYLFSCATSKASSLTTVDVTGLETGDVTTLTGYESWNTGALESLYQMFNYVQSMETIDLSNWDLDQVKNTGWCFQLCYAKQILLPENLGVISSGFLNHATQVQGSTFTIPAGVQKIGYGHTIYDFATDDFVEFLVAEGNTCYKAVDGILYSADGREMLAVPRGKIFENNTYEIPEGVTFLGELSFSRNYNIQTLVLPNSFVLEYVPVKDPAYVVYEDVGNLNAGTNLSIAIYCYTGITAYAVKEDNPNYTSRDGILYSKDMTQVVAIPARYDRLMDIPEGVTTWNMEAMWADYENNSNLDSLMANCPGVVIPASLTQIAGDQINRLNRLNRAYDTFSITVAEGNPVYCVDENGDLVPHSPAESIVTPPTCTEGGYTTHTCAICGDSYVGSYTDALGHSYQNGICTGCGESEPNPYAGKTIACIGDSITYGVGVTRDETDYVTLLAQSLGMEYIRLGVSGTTLCTGGHATCNVSKLTESNLAGADVVTILIGINDFVQARTGYYSLGTIDSTDTSTIYGAVHMWCQRIVELRETEALSETEFYFLTPVITSWNNSVSSVRDWDQSKTNIHGYTLRDLCNAIVEVCALYDVPVIDLNVVSGLYYNSEENNTVDEFGGDGAHPGVTGHQMMAAALENILLRKHLKNDHDHVYGSWITTTYPGCEKGEQKRVCSVCSATESRPVDAVGHTYQNGICTVCGVSRLPGKAFYWQMGETGLVSVVQNDTAQNNLDLKSGSVTDGVLTNTQFRLEDPVMLYHDRPWVVEWRSQGNWKGMLFGSSLESPSSGLTYLFRDTATRLFAFGEYNGTWNNYGIILDCDMTTSHVFRLENRIGEDGTNTVYLVIDGQEVGAMTQYYITGNSQNQDVNWANGKDIVFSSLGTSSHPINAMQLDYLRVWENGHVHTYESTVTPPTCTERGYTTFTCLDCGYCYTGDITGIPINKNINFVGMSIWYFDGKVLPEWGIGGGEVARGFQTLLKEHFAFRSTTNYCYSGYSLGALSLNDSSSIAAKIDTCVTAGEEGDIWTLDTNTNDFRRDIPIGSIDDYLNDTGATTFYGALRIFHDRVVELSGESAIVICSNATRRNTTGYTSTSANACGHTLADYEAAVKTIAALNGWYFVDQFNDSGITEENLSTVTIDGLHPNNEGYLLAVRPWIEQIAVFAHNYESIITAPTCMEQGYTTHTCSGCGDSYVDSYTDALGHSYQNGICTGCGGSVLDLGHTHALPENQGVQNAIDRAYLLTDVEWTPLADVPGLMDAEGTYHYNAFLAGVTYKGIPYSGVIDTDTYVGLNVSLESFLTALENEKSVLYTENLFVEGYPKKATYFGTVCSKFAQYVLDIPGSYNTYNIPNIPGVDTIAMPGEYAENQIELGDIIVDTSYHTAVCTGILYDADGDVAYIEISEAVVPTVRRLWWSVEEFFAHFANYRLCRYQFVDAVPAVETVITAETDYALMPRYGNKYNYRVSTTKGIVDILKTGYSKAVILRDGEVIDEIAIDDTTEIISFDCSVPGYIEVYLEKADGTRSDSVYACVVESAVQVTDSTDFASGKLTVTFDGSSGTPLYVQVGSAHAIFCNVEGQQGTAELNFNFSSVSTQQVRVAYQNEYGIYLSAWTSFTAASNPSTDPLLSQGKYWDGYTLTPNSATPVVQENKVGYWTYTMVPVEANTTYYSEGANRMWFLDENGDPISTYNAYRDSEIPFQFTTPAGTAYVSLSYSPDLVEKGAETLGERKELHLRYDDHYDITGKTVQIIDEGQPTSYQVGYDVEENTVLDTAVVTLVGDTMVATGIGTAKVRIDGQLYAVTVTAAPISLLLLIGQSNMEGNEGDPNQSIVCPDGMVYATYGDRYDMDITNATHYAPSALTGQYREINTVGGTDGLCDYPVYMLTDEGAGRKGPDSGFAYEWVKQTGEKVWIVNASHGGTSINVWQPGTTQYEECQAMFGACAETLRKEIAAGHFTLSHMAYFWCQGCNDYTMTAENYVSKYLTMHESLKTELAFDHDSDGNTPQKTFEYGGIIPVRAGSNWSNGYRTGIYTDTTTGSNYESFKDLQMTGPRVAQYWMGNNPDLPDIWLVCNIGEKWVYMPDGTDGVADYFLAHYENGTVDYTTQVKQRESWYTPTTPAAVHDSIHYNQIGYNEVGRESVRTALINMGLLEAPEVDTSVTFVTWDGYSTAEEITASTTASSGTLVVPVVYPLWDAKTIAYTLSEGLRWEWYDLLADSGETEGILKAQGAAEGEVRVVKAEPGAIYADHLSELPENLCCGVNLWSVLEHDPYYYHTGTRWGIHESGTVYSVTIPIQPGDRIYATAFGKAGENGYASASGIRVTFFGEYGVVKTMEPTQTYTEFAANGGYIIAPEGATAVNIPMWTNDDSHEIYILNLPHDETTEICSVCGKTSHIHTWSAWEVVTPPSADGPGTEQRTCACGETESRQVDGVWQTHDLGAHLQDLPERYCAGLNLWSVLEHDEEYYYSGLYWGTNAGVLVYSITIPVNPGDRIYATSFEAAGINGNSSAGIRVTFFDTYGIAKTLTPTQTHDEFTANGGYLVAPEGTIAVNIPVYGNCSKNQVYLLNAEHDYDAVVTEPTCTEQGYTTHTCAICGDSYVDDYTDRRPLNILMIGNSFTWDAADCWYGLTESMTYAMMKSMLADGYDVHMGVMYKGSATLAYHATSAMNNTGGYAYTEIGPDTGYVWNPSSGGEEPNYILDHLNDRDWDIIVIQSYQHEADGTEPRSTYTGGDARFTDPRDSLAYLLDYFAQHKPGAKVYYYMPWSTVKFYGTDGTRAGFEAIAEYSETVIPHITGTNSGAALAGIIPVGTAIENARTTYLHDLRYSEIKTGTAQQQDVQIGLLYDSQHLSFGIGRYIAGTVVAETLIPQQMRKDNITPPDIKDSPAVGALPQEYSVIARLAAQSALQHPYQVTAISGYEVDLAERIADAIQKADFAADGIADENALLAHIEAVVAEHLLEAGDADVQITIHSFRLENGKLMELEAAITFRVGYTTATAQISVSDGVTHCFGPWEHLSEPTPEKPGSRCRTCSVCGFVQTEEIDGSWQKYNLAAHLQQLPEGVCCGTNLWDALEPESVMIDHLGNWVSAGATVYSITIPIQPGDRIYANSFVEKGIQVSFIGTYGIIKTNFSSDTLREFNENGGYLIAPEGSIAVNIPVWNVNDERNTVNILNYEHAFGAVTVEPTCTEQGYTTHTCTICGDSYVDSITGALGHSYDSVVTDPTCTQAGYTTHTCGTCGDSYVSNYTDALGHSYESVVTEPTCTQAGYTTYTCGTCGDSYVSNHTDAQGHEYGDWYVLTEATLNTPGEERRDCIRCDHYESRVIPMLENPFVDVTQEWYYYDAVLWAYYEGITTGRTETEFMPNEPCTRDQIVTFLWRASGCPEPESLEYGFTDVVSGSFYEKAVAWAVENGITKGLTKTAFGPTKPCTRDQVVTFLWRYFGSPEPTIDNPFEDVEEGKFYDKAVLWAYENGITTGKTATTFLPHTTCTRGQIMTFLFRAMAEE